MGQKDLECLVGKLCSIHLAVPGVVAHLSHIQRAPNQGGVYWVWLSTALHCKLADWKVFALQLTYRPMHLAVIVCREPTHLGICDASGLGAGGVGLDPAGTGHNLVWQNTWSADVTAELVSPTNPNGTISNSDPELAALVLQEATLLKAAPKARMAVPRSA